MGLSFAAFLHFLPDVPLCHEMYACMPDQIKLNLPGHRETSHAITVRHGAEFIG
jgi:hypothetical protein